MLDIFILPAQMSHSYYNKTVESFEKFSFPVTIRKISSFYELIHSKKSNPFYSYFFDVEKVSADLRDGLSMFLRFMAMGKFDVLVLYKRNVRRGEAQFNPRIFRENITLDSRTLLPVNTLGLKTEHVLNGWIVEHGYEDLHTIRHKALSKMVISNGERV